MFKKGDRVRCKGGYSFDPSEGIIRSKLIRCYKVRITKGKDNHHKAHCWWYSGSDLQPLLLPQEEIVKTFNDRIKHDL